MVGAPKRKKEAEASFHDVLADGGPTPESIMIARMRGAATVRGVDGTEIPLTASMYEAAKDMIQFRLPRLNSIDAVQRNVDMTHEEWIRQMDEGGDE